MIVTQEVDSVPACAAAVIYIQQKETLEKQYWTFSIHKTQSIRGCFGFFASSVGFTVVLQIQLFPYGPLSAIFAMFT